MVERAEEGALQVETFARISTGEGTDGGAEEWEARSIFGIGSLRYFRTIVVSVIVGVSGFGIGRGHVHFLTVAEAITVCVAFFRIRVSHKETM